VKRDRQPSFWRSRKLGFPYDTQWRPEDSSPVANQLQTVLSPVLATQDRTSMHVRVTRDDVSTPESARPTGSRFSMPTLAACSVACIALVVTVGLQSPAVSAGFRWMPEPRGQRKFKEIEPLQFSFAVGELPPADDWWPPLLTWILVALVVIALLVFLARWIRSQTRRAPAMHVARVGADGEVPTEAEAQILQSGLAAAIQILSSDRDLSNAVVQAWQGLQDAAATAGLHRRPAETASEFTARILYRSRGSAQPIAVLLSLYQRVRFGEHAPSAEEIETARHSLVVLVKLWEADFPKRRLVKEAH
jgi:hypothetical protein